MSPVRRSKTKELFPKELHLHIDRLEDSTLDSWEQIRTDTRYFSNVNSPSFSDYANVLQRVVEKGIIQDSEFVWLAAKAGVIVGQLNRVLDFAWRDQSPGVRAQAALAHAFKGQTKDAMELLKAAERRAEAAAAQRHEDLEILVEIWGVRTFTLTVQKKFQEAIGEYLKAGQVAHDGSRLEQWLQWARARHAYALLKLSYISDASAVNQKVLTLANSANDRFFKAQALTGLGHCLDRLGRTDDALSMYNRALVVATDLEASNIKSLVLNRLGMAMAYRKKRLDDSVDYFRRAIATAQEGGSLWLEFGPMANLAIVKKRKGVFFEAGELFEVVRDRAELVGDLHDQLFAHINLADIYAELGDDLRASESKEVAQELARQLRQDSS